MLLFTLIQLYPEFKPRTYEYYTTVPNMVDSVKVTAEMYGSGAKLSVSGEIVGYGNVGKHVSSKIPVAEGPDNNITIEVSSEKSKLNSTYVVHIFRRKDQADLPSHLASVSAMEIDFDGKKKGDGIKPNFSPEELAYSAKVPHTTKIVSVVVLAMWPIGRYPPSEEQIRETVSTTARARVDASFLLYIA